VVGASGGPSTLVRWLGVARYSEDCVLPRSWAVAQLMEAIAATRNLASFAHVSPPLMPWRARCPHHRPRRRHYSALTRLSQCHLWPQQRCHCTRLSAAACNSRSPRGIVASFLGVVAVPSSVGISEWAPHVAGPFPAARGHSRHGACSPEEVRGRVGRLSPRHGPLGAWASEVPRITCMVFGKESSRE
jgi:hypothetical protein